MKQYKLLGDIMLSFLTERDQLDCTIGPQEGGTLETDGVTVWYVQPNGKKHETITTANIIDVALESGKIEEIL